MNSLTSNAKFFHLLILQLSDCTCVQNYPFVSKGNKSNKTKPYQKLQTLKVLVLNKFDHVFNVVMLISKKMKRREKCKGDAVVQALFLIHRIQV